MARSLFVRLLCALLVLPCSTGAAELRGEPRRWHPLELRFEGPTLDESGDPSPFLDHRLEVIWVHPARGDTLIVPGHWAADGQAADSGAHAGRIWRAWFLPPHTGTWRWTARFRTGVDVALLDDPDAGKADAFDGESGQVEILASDKAWPDLRVRGLLLHPDGAERLRFAGTDEPYTAGGLDGPSNLLSYQDFDGGGVHAFAAHLPDWRPGDPQWGAGRGRALVGALNYLAEAGMDLLVAAPLRVRGKVVAVHPWSSASRPRCFDVSRLDQWERVLAHGSTRGLAVRLDLEDGGGAARLEGSAGLRRLYYREMVSRLGHLPGLIWCVDRAGGADAAAVADRLDLLDSLDPYQHPRTVLPTASSAGQVLADLAGRAGLDGPWLQVANVHQVHGRILQWRQAAADAGAPWAVLVGQAAPAPPDSQDPDHDTLRQEVLWGSLLAGGAGLTWYLGEEDDDGLEDLRSRAILLQQTRHALELWRSLGEHLPHLQPAPERTEAGRLCLSRPGWIHVVYGVDSGPWRLDLGSSPDYHRVRWLDAAHGGGLRTGTVEWVLGPGWVDLGEPPSPGGDWTAVVDLPVGTAAPPAGATAARLGPGRPNPFNPRTVLPLVLARAQRVRVEVVDVRGRRLRTLFAGELPAGEHALVWDGADDGGRPVASGVYHVVLRSADGAAHRPVTLVR